MAASIVTTLLALNGGARHLYYLSPPQISAAVKLDWVAQPFAIAAFGLGKISTAFLVLRILKGATVWRKKFLYGSMGITIVSTTVSIVVLFAQCSPPRALWDQVPGAKCWSANVGVDIQIINAGMYIETSQCKIITLGRADG